MADQKEMDDMVKEMEKMEKELEVDMQMQKEKEQENENENKKENEEEKERQKENGGLEGDDKFEPEHVRKLFVNNLNYRTTDESLKKYFENWGEVVNAMVVKYPNTERSRGFGYVTFATDEMVDEAQKARPHRVDCRVVITKRAVPRFDIGKPEVSASVKRLYISGLNDEVDEDALAAHFRGFGKIMNISIVIDKVTGKKRGFGFMEFDDDDTVDKICLMKSHTICGKTVDVKKALTQFEMARIHEGAGQAGDRGRGGGRGGGIRGGGSRYQNPWANQSGGNQGGQNWGNNGVGSRYQQGNAPGPIRDNFGGNAGRPGPYSQGGGGGENFMGNGGRGGSGSSQNWGNNSFGGGYQQGNNFGGGGGRGGNPNSGYQGGGNFGGGYNQNNGGNNFGGGRGNTNSGFQGSNQSWGTNNSGGGYNQNNGGNNFGGRGDCGPGQAWNNNAFGSGSQLANSSGRGNMGDGGQIWSNNSFGGGNFGRGGGRGGYSESGTGGDTQRRLPIDGGIEYRGAIIDLSRKTGVVSFEMSPDCYQKARFRREDTRANGVLVDQTAKLYDLFSLGMESTLFITEHYDRPMDPSIVYVARVNVIVPADYQRPIKDSCRPADIHRTHSDTSSICSTERVNMF